MVIMRTSPQSIPTPARRYSGWHFQLFRRLAVLPYKRSAVTVVTIAWMLVAGAVFKGRETKAQTILIPEGNPAISMEHFLGNAWSIAVDQDGHIYVADPINQVIRKYCPDGTPATVIGQVNRSGRVDGTAAEARFASPGSLCYDGAGGILVLDNSTYVRRINVATLTVSTLANLSGGVDGAHMYDVTLGTFSGLRNVEQPAFGPDRRAIAGRLLRLRLGHLGRYAIPASTAGRAGGRHLPHARRLRRPGPAHAGWPLIRRATCSCRSRFCKASPRSNISFASLAAVSRG